MSEIRILNLCYKKSISVDIYRQSLLKDSWEHLQQLRGMQNYRQIPR